MIIGSHVSVSAPDYLLQAIKDTISYEANACMIYTGAPSNSRRVDIDKFKIEEAKALMAEFGIKPEHIIIHAPYLINLANTFKPETFTGGVEFLIREIERTKAIGAKTIVLHPGSHVNAGTQVGIRKICEGLDLAMENIGDVKIALETMAGKGSECGCDFHQLKAIIDGCRYKDSLAVCFDTCHVHDSGRDLAKFDELLDEFDEIIGLDRLSVIHLNDSKNVCGARKDRHENIGYGKIGFDILNMIAHHSRLENIPKILETPYVNDLPPYKEEIAMLRRGVFDDRLLDRE